MLIKGVQGTTLVDFPGNVASIFFLANCNFRCPFCYNKDLVLNPETLRTIPEKDALEILEKRKGLIDGVVITGGEPTLHQDLPEFMLKIKKMGLKVKLDTNGTNPKMLKRIIDETLADYFAMDIKTSPEKYGIATGTKPDLKAIDESAKMIMESKIGYGFRTTVVPGLVELEDIEKIGKWLEGAEKYFIQQFRPMQTTIDPAYSKTEPYSKETLLLFKKTAEKYFKKCEIRSI